MYLPHRIPPTDQTRTAEESLVKSGKSRGKSQPSVQPAPVQIPITRFVQCMIPR